MARRSCRPSVQKFLEADSLISNGLPASFHLHSLQSNFSTSTRFLTFSTVSAFRTLFVQWKHHISICYCFDFRCSCRTCHNKKTIQQDFVRIWTDSGVYRDSIIVAIWNLTPTQTGFLKVSPLIFKNLLFINSAKACNEIVSNWGPAHSVLVLWSRSIGHPLWFYFLGLRNASVWRKSVIFLSLQFQKGV